MTRPPVADRYAKAVTLPDGSIENFLLKVVGKQFRCDCGSNVFHKPDRKYPEIYECNGCGSRYSED